MCVCVLYLCEKGNRQTDMNFQSYLFYVISGSHDYEDCCLVGCDAVHFGS